MFEEDKYIFRLCKVLKKGESYYNDLPTGSREKVATIDGTDDEFGGDRIRVRIRGVDDDIPNDNDLPYCFPLLPKMMHIKPKPGEMVMVFCQEQGRIKDGRFYIGPIIPQEYDLPFSAFDNSSKFFTNQHTTDVLPNPKMNPENQGTLLENDDVALKGRKNADVVLKDNEVRIRCGYKTNNDIVKKDSLIYNDNDMAYVQMKYQSAQDENEKTYNSAINVVADKINLLSHQSKTPFELSDNKELIAKDEMEKILKQAHALPYGDLLVEFLKNFLIVFGTHTHPFSMMPPVMDSDMKKVLSTDLNNMLSKNIKIN